VATDCRLTPSSVFPKEPVIAALRELALPFYRVLASRQYGHGTRQSGPV